MGRYLSEEQCGNLFPGTRGGIQIVGIGLGEVEVLNVDETVLQFFRKGPSQRTFPRAVQAAHNDSDSHNRLLKI